MASYDDTATVSGSVAYFSDGADDVPTKSVKIAIPASLDGVSAVSVVNSGKNLANIGAVESCTNTSGAGSSITQNNDGSITIVTTTQQNVKCLQKFSDIFPSVKVGQTCILSATTTGTQRQIYLHGVSTVWTFGQSKTITEGMLNSDVSFYASGNNTTATVSNFQLEYGSTASAYTPYIAPTTYTANLGRTIYGGEVDIVNGTGTDENGNDFTFTGQEVPTRLGYNAFWSEQGDTELTYYKDGYGFTSVTIHKETPEGEPVEQTAKFHRIVYGGTADVIRGTCEPKNLFVKDNPNEVDGYFTTTGFSTGNTNAKTVCIPIVGGETYTVSKTAGQRFQIATAEVIPSNGASFTGRQANNTATSLTITASANDKYLWAWVFLDGTDTGTLSDMLDSVQIEKGSSATEYAPGFTPFSFPPISMSTDEGENTLFANEGASAITYRKETD